MIQQIWELPPNLDDQLYVPLLLALELVNALDQKLFEGLLAVFGQIGHHVGDESLPLLWIVFLEELDGLAQLVRAHATNKLVD